MFFSKKMKSKDFKKIREDAGLSRADVAEALGVSFPTVQKWETSEDEVKLSLTQFEVFMRIVSSPEEQRIIQEKMDSIASLWMDKLKN